MPESKWEKEQQVANGEKVEESRRKRKNNEVREGAAGTRQQRWERLDDSIRTRVVGSISIQCPPAGADDSG